MRKTAVYMPIAQVRIQRARHIFKYVFALTFFKFGISRNFGQYWNILSLRKRVK